MALVHPGVANAVAPLRSDSVRVHIQGQGVPSDGTESPRSFSRGYGWSPDGHRGYGGVPPGDKWGYGWSPDGQQSARAGLIRSRFSRSGPPERTSGGTGASPREISGGTGGP